MPDVNRIDTSIEAFEVDLDTEPGEDPYVTAVHLIEKWGMPHPPTHRMKRRTLTADEKASPDTNGGYNVHVRGIVTVDGVAWEVKELSHSQIPDNYDDVDVLMPYETRWYLRKVPFEEGHGGRSPRFTDDVTDDDLPDAAAGNKEGGA